MYSNFFNFKYCIGLRRYVKLNFCNCGPNECKFPGFFATASNNYDKQILIDKKNMDYNEGASKYTRKNQLVA